jgi:AcrR family transcriptional regulator
MVRMKKGRDSERGGARTARERILETAHDLFYRDGIRATGVDRIIEQGRVTKVTFYRHFPSKNDLVAAYLDYRHEQWMGWFADALARAPRRSGFPLEPVLAALKEWFATPGYRGCAFINGVVELEGAGTWVAEVSLRHKKEMSSAIEALLPAGKERGRIAQAAAMAVDGAIIRVQMEKRPRAALAVLETLLRALCESSMAGTPATAQSGV